jgi:Mitochondrial carrier protein
VVLTRVSTPLQCASARTGVLGKSTFCSDPLKSDVWFSIGLTRLVENTILKARGKKDNQSLGAMDKMLSSSIGGALATWNQPIEVIRVEVFVAYIHCVLSSMSCWLQMQNMSKEATASANRPAKLTIFNTFGYIYKENGIKGLYRGVTPRIALGIWQTICMVSFADYVKVWVKGNNQKV